MKKALLILFIFSISLLKAQDLTSKHGEPYLPEAKDWAIGIGANDLIKNINFGFVNATQSIYGKYFLDATTALRFGLRLGFNSNSIKTIVADRTKIPTYQAYPAAIPFVTNIWTRTSGVIGLNFGIEKRRGKTRLQGIYGFEGEIYFSSSKDNFTYGNKLNASNLNNVDVDTVADAMKSPVFGNADNVNVNPPIQGVKNYARITERKNGAIFAINARIFVGVEYFILPKFSIGGEFGWGPTFSIAGRSQTTYESIGTSTAPGATGGPTVRTTTFDGAQMLDFTLDNSNSAFGGSTGSLKINLYF